MSEIEEKIESMEETITKLEKEVNTSLSKIKDIEKNVNRLEKLYVDEEEELKELTPKQEEIYEEFIMSHPEGLGVWDLAEDKDVSYSAGYKILEELKDKGYLEEVWEEKGNKKKYRVVED